MKQRASLVSDALLAGALRAIVDAWDKTAHAIRTTGASGGQAFDECSMFNVTIHGGRTATAYPMSQIVEVSQGRGAVFATLLIQGGATVDVLETVDWWQTHMVARSAKKWIALADSAQITRLLRVEDIAQLVQTGEASTNVVTNYGVTYGLAQTINTVGNAIRSSCGQPLIDLAGMGPACNEGEHMDNMQKLVEAVQAVAQERGIAQTTAAGAPLCVMLWDPALFAEIDQGEGDTLIFRSADDKHQMAIEAHKLTDSPGLLVIAPTDFPAES